MHGRSYPWTEAETRRALDLKRQGQGFEMIAAAVGRTTEAVKSRLKILNMSPEALADRKARYAARQARYRAAEPKATSGLAIRSNHRPSAEQVEERDTRFSYPRSFEQVYLGDPLPGQSALDKRNQEACRG